MQINFESMQARQVVVCPTSSLKKSLKKMTWGKSRLTPLARQEDHFFEHAPLERLYPVDGGRGGGMGKF